MWPLLAWAMVRASGSIRRRCIVGTTNIDRTLAAILKWAAMIADESGTYSATRQNRVSRTLPANVQTA